MAEQLQERPTVSAPRHTPVSPSPSAPPQGNSNVDIETPPSKSEEDQPPNGGYGWVCVACCFWINGSTWGINSTYAVFLAYYLSHDYFPNTSALAYAFIGGLSISMAMLVAPLATKCTATFGTKVTLHVGVFFETLSLIGASFATQKYQLLLAQGVCFGWGMGFLFVGSVGIIPQWFTTRKSVANAVAAAGSGCGGLIWSLSTQAMIDNLGLPWAFRILGVLSFTINLICSNIIRDRNAQVGARNRSFDWSLLKRPEFLLVQAWSWLSMFGYVTVLFSLPSYARQIGLTAQQGSIIGAIFNLGQMLGRPFIGLASDRFGRINLAALLSAMCGVFCLVFWIPAEVVGSQMGLLTFFSVVGGALAGTFWTTIAPVAAEVVGIQDLGSALSWTWLIMVPPVTCAEAIALEIRRVGVVDFVYINAQVFCAVSYIAGGLVMWVLRGWKIGEMEEIERIKHKEERRRAQRGAMLQQESEKGHAHSHDGERDSTLTREVSALSARKQGWDLKDLLRRMMKVQKV
ncbi:hypothetical protein LTR70_007714 [Exophiala xenobiotica]|uniref:MFS transporter n=1 Tax=Lithohypha guttulata TaxID=1690604 RepID=A0ABR0K3F9_9EURO|nr:hypothetical protein LTR24_007272 [Lithohypha guttulata]KAK5313305.1 hypothetical protein LTR70_007714 [Exophiala xenobiotica]